MNYRSGGSKVDASLTTTILSGAAQSAEVDLSGYTLCGLTLPSTFDGTTLIVQVATATGGTFMDLIIDGSSTAVSYEVTASRYVALDANLFRGVRFFKVTSGSSQTTTNTIITVHRRVVT